MKKLAAIVTVLFAVGLMVSQGWAENPSAKARKVKVIQYPKPALLGIKCSTANTNLATITCNRGEGEALKEAQDAYIEKLRGLLTDSCLSKLCKEIRKQPCHYKLTGKVNVIVGSRELTPKEKALCIQKKKAEGLTVTDEDCNRTVVTEPWNEYEVSCGTHHIFKPEHAPELKFPRKPVELH